MFFYLHYSDARKIYLIILKTNCGSMNVGSFSRFKCSCIKIYLTDCNSAAWVITLALFAFLLRDIRRRFFQYCRGSNYWDRHIFKFSICRSLRSDLLLLVCFLCCSFSPGVPNLFLTMYPFSIPTNEHVPLKHFNR